MIEKFSSKEVTSRSKLRYGGGNLASVEAYTKLFHSLKECLSNTINSGTLDASLIAEVYACAGHFLALPVSTDTAESVSLISLARDAAQQNTEPNQNSSRLAYIYEVSLWLSKCGTFLRDQALAATLCGFVARNNKNEGVFR